MSDFNIVLISAGFENGGNVFHRHMDGHPSFYVYPFESQIGVRRYNHQLSNLERTQYRYPEFDLTLSNHDIYENIIDEELKTFLRKKNYSKFNNVSITMDESTRFNYFNEYIDSTNKTRKSIVEALFIATFKSWENYYKSDHMNTESIYVGYSPGIILDTERIIRDFPNAKIIHVIRNPFSAYSDTKKRPFPLNLSDYILSWNIYHSQAISYSKLYPNNVMLVSYDNFIKNKKSVMVDVSSFLSIEFNEALLYPSFNGVRIDGDISPWGTVLRDTNEYNQNTFKLLTEHEKIYIEKSTQLVRDFMEMSNNR